MFAREPDAFDSDAKALGGIFATHAAVALYGANKTDQFESTLASRDTIGQAKGMLMERYRIDAVQASRCWRSCRRTPTLPWPSWQAT